ncbi:MAG: vitamin K epoxide reductase family protein [Candidatus Kapaibacterium sp.]
MNALTLFIGVLALSGAWISVYMAFGYYGTQPMLGIIARTMPAICRVNDSACELILRHPSSKVLGLPNFYFGLGYYLLILITLLTHNWVLLWVVRWAAVMTLMMSAYLVYALTFQIKRSCVLCYAAHTINATLSLLVWNIPDF